MAKRSDYKPVECRRYLSRAAELGCALCRRLGWGATPAQLHHPRTGVGGGRRAPHSESIPLCQEHHTGASGVHGMGRRAWEAEFGVTEGELTKETQGLARLPANVTW